MRSSLLTIALLTACAGSPGEGKPRAEVAEVPAAAAEATPAKTVAADAVAATNTSALVAPSVTAPSVLAVDPATSKLGVIGAKITAKHPVVFHTFQGSVGLDGETVTAVAFAADVASLESDHPKLTEHLKGEDFLHVAEFPRATFASTSVTPGAETEGTTHTVVGDLTIRGKTLRVTFPATIAVTPEGVTAKTEFVINRQDFGVTYPGRADDLVQDDVLMQVNLAAPRT